VHVAAAGEHGVAALIADLGIGLASAPRFVSALRARAVKDAALDAIREKHLRCFLDACAAAGLRPLLMKGGALAYTHYARPDLRARFDTDILVAPDARERAVAILASSGYVAIPQAGGELIAYQAAYATRLGDVSIDTIDLHWRIANPQQFGPFLSYDDAERQAVSVPALAPQARALGPVHALLLACVHRVAHHFDAPHLIWLYDLRLLAERFTAAEWRAFVALAHERGVATVTQRSLARARFMVGAPIADDTLEALTGQGAADAATAAYLAPGRRHVQDVLADLRSLGSWRDRWSLVRQHMFPPAGYMRTVYAPASTTPLPMLYALRCWRGARKWLARS